MGNHILVNRQGKFMDFENVYVSNKIAKVNILSVSAITEVDADVVFVRKEKLFNVYPLAPERSTYRSNYIFLY